MRNHSQKISFCLQPMKKADIILPAGCTYGEMAERLMALVLKTSDAERHRGFESLSLRHLLAESLQHSMFWRSTQVAIRGSPAKGVVLDNGSRGSNPRFSALTQLNLLKRFCCNNLVGLAEGALLTQCPLRVLASDFL